MRSRGFTLIELLVVIAIIGLLSSVVLASLNTARERARIARAQSELQSLRSVMEIMRNDTGYYSNRAAATVCANGNERALDTSYAGLLSTDGFYPNWNGPYTDSIPRDPWGSKYRIDGDYKCRKEATGCEVDDPELDSGVILSCGPNKSCAYDTDNVVIVMCKR